MTNLKINILLPILLILLTAFNANARAAKKNGVDFDLIDWNQLCPTVGPVTLNFLGGSCSGVHPTELEKYDDGMGYAKEKPNCAKYQKLYSVKTHKSVRYDNWNHCKSAFETKLGSMILHTESYTDSEVLNFRDKYLFEGVVDGNAILKTREIYRISRAKSAQKDNK